MALPGLTSIEIKLETESVSCQMTFLNTSSYLIILVLTTLYLFQAGFVFTFLGYTLHSIVTNPD